MDDLPSWVHYVAALGPAATLLAAVIAGLIAWRSYVHRRVQDRKDEWWRRTQWALDRALSDEGNVQDVALKVLELQAESSLASDEEQLIMNAVGTDVIEPARPAKRESEVGIRYHLDTGVTRKEDDQ